MLYPFLSVLATSLASEPDVIKNGGLVIWPEHPTLNAYRTIFPGGVVTRAITVSVGITVIGTLLSMAVTIGMAYGLSRRIWGSRFFLLLALTTLLFTPGIIPNYLAVKQYGLLNSYAVADPADPGQRLQPGRAAAVLHEHSRASCSTAPRSTAPTTGRS